MIAKRLGILGVIAVLPVFGQLSSAVNTAPRQHLPIRDRQERGDGTVVSTNWSGYAVTGSSFTSAVGSWVVPTATCGAGYRYAAFWVGIDGYSSDTVEQTGTDSDCDGGTPNYYAWYEFYPFPSFNIPSLTITPGDRISAQVVYDGSEFTVTITDVTTGKTFSKSATVSSAKRSSAEWIAEAPSSGIILPLADYGTVLFGEDNTSIAGTCNATDSTTNGHIGAFSTIEEITMEKKSVKESIPSALSSDGTSFSVTWAAQ